MVPPKERTLMYSIPIERVIRKVLWWMYSRKLTETDASSSCSCCSDSAGVADDVGVGGV